MKPDDDTPDSTAGADAWLDGLAGRGGDSAEARDGARLRTALNTTDDKTTQAAPPPWSEIVAATNKGETIPVETPVKTAANDVHWKRLAAVGALGVTLIVGAGLWNTIGRHGDDAGTLRGKASHSEAVWRTENPSQAAVDLSARLEHAGARVTVTPTDSGLLLQVKCERDSESAVNAQLASIEAAVDTNGQLAIRLLPLK